jgi:5S rRNA maturation endonuclease (ribonuclease M5)
MKLHQNGCRKVVALMNDTLSPAQETLISTHTGSQSQVIVLLGGNAAGRAAREDIACRLSKHCFVKVHTFDKADAEPEHLTAEELQEILEGVSERRAT